MFSGLNTSFGDCASCSSWAHQTSNSCCTASAKSAKLGAGGPRAPLIISVTCAGVTKKSWTSITIIHIHILYINIYIYIYLIYAHYMANHMQRMQKARGDVHRLIFCMCLCLRVRVCVFTLWLNMVFRLRRSTTGSSILAANIIIEKHHESWHIRTAAISTIITHHAKQCKTMQNESGPGRIPRLARLCRPASGNGLWGSWRHACTLQ